MSALEFLEALEQEYRDMGYHTSATLLHFPLMSLKNGNKEEATQTIDRGKEFLLGEMRKGSYETERHGRDLAILTVLDKMIESDKE